MEFSFLPGAVNASTATAVPDNWPDFDYIDGVIVETEASGGTASVTSPTNATVVYAIPAGGLAATDFYYDSNTRQWQYGTATTTGTVFRVQGPKVGQRTKVA